MELVSGIAVVKSPILRALGSTRLDPIDPH